VGLARKQLQQTGYNCFVFEIKDYANVYILVLTNGGYYFTKGAIKLRLANKQLKRVRTVGHFLSTPM